MIFLKLTTWLLAVFSFFFVPIANAVKIIFTPATILMILAFFEVVGRSFAAKAFALMLGLGASAAVIGYVALIVLVVKAMRTVNLDLLTSITYAVDVFSKKTTNTEEE